MPVEEETFRESHEQAHSHLTSLSSTRRGLVVDVNSTHASLIQDHQEFLSQVAGGDSPRGGQPQVVRWQP